MESKLSKIVSILTPIALHAQGISVVDLFSERGQKPESMAPDVASVMFVAATSMIVTELLAKNPIRLSRRNADSGGGDELPLVVLVIGVLANTVACDLTLRVIWIPMQYFIRYLKEQELLVVAIRWMFFYFRYFRFTRTILISWIKASKTNAGFLFVRNLLSTVYLLVTLTYLDYFSNIKELMQFTKKKAHPTHAH